MLQEEKLERQRSYVINMNKNSLESTKTWLNVLATTGEGSNAKQENLKISEPEISSYILIIKPATSSGLAVRGTVSSKLFPNGTACSPITYTSHCCWKSIRLRK